MNEYERVSSYEHWICKNCEVLNHLSRDYCLSCERPKKAVILTDELKLTKLRDYMYGRSYNVKGSRAKIGKGKGYRET